MKRYWISMRRRMRNVRLRWRRRMSLLGFLRGLLSLAPVATAVTFLSVNALGKNPPPQGTLLKQALALLVLIATTLFLSEFGVRRIERHLGEIKDHVVRKDLGSALMEQNDLPAFADTTREARTIQLLGTSLVSLLTKYDEDFGRLVRRGAKIEIALVDPEGAAGETAERALYNLNFRGALGRDSASTLEAVQQLAPLMAYDGQIELCLIDYFPFGSLTCARSEPSHRSTIIGSIYPFKLPADKRAHFVLHSDVSPWYDHFEEQIDKTWETFSTTRRALQRDGGWRAAT